MRRLRSAILRFTYVIPVIILLSGALLACGNDADQPNMGGTDDGATESAATVPGGEMQANETTPTVGMMTAEASPASMMEDTDTTPMTGMMRSSDGTPTDSMGGGMGGEALGGTAQTMMLAEATVEMLPDEPLAWVAHESGMPAAADPVTHDHDGPGFVYAAQGAHTVTIDGEEVMLQPGEAVFVAEGVEHTHDGQSVWWDIRLVDPESDAPSGMENATQVFASPPLEGIPMTPVQLAFILVELPPDSQTSVHTHPGPEYIYVTQGDIEYQNAIIGTERTAEGEDHALPADTAVQKRNPEGGVASFLSFFVVDPDEPFAPEAGFE